MNGTEFLDRMELVEDRFVDEAAHPAKARRPWLKWGALAACAVLAVTAVLSGGVGQSLPAYPENLVLPAEGPLVRFPLPEEEPDGMGMDAVQARDSAGLLTGNPWAPEMGLTGLPVYRNTAYEGEKPFDRMQQLLLSAAARLGLDTESLEITDDAITGEEKQAIIDKYVAAGDPPPPDSFFAPGLLMAQQGNVQLTVDQRMQLWVEFTEPVPLPEELTFPGFAADPEESRAVGEYLAEEYGDFLGMEQPVLALEGGGLGTDGRPHYDLYFYEGAGSDLEQVLNYNFNRVWFGLDESGSLARILMDRPDLTCPLGSYPILTEAEARRELLAGHYRTDTPTDEFSEADIRRVQIVYRVDFTQPVLVPYYRYEVDVTGRLGFSQEVLDRRGPDVRDYGAYYVPAVTREYWGE